MTFNLLNFSLIFYGYPVSKAKHIINKLRNSNNLEEYHDETKWEIYNFHLDNNKFYKDVIAEKGSRSENWLDIPVLTKKTLQSAYPDYLNRRQTKIHSKTSGSTGKPLFIGRDKLTHALIWEYAQQMYHKNGISYGLDLEARFYGASRQRFSLFKEKIKDGLARRKRFIIHNLSKTKLDEFLGRFRKDKFKFIYGYTNSILFFSKYLISQDIILLDVCPTLEICIVTAENCDNDDRLIMEKAFGIPVVIEYGSSESGIIAIEDLKRNWVVADELLYVEILNDENLPVKPGELGKVVITSLHNRSMPFIRYEIGDTAAMVFNSKIGRNVIIKLAGRLNDFAILPDGKIVPGFSLYYFIKDVLKAYPGILEYLIIQHSKEEFEVQVVTTTELNENIKLLIIDTLKNYLFREVNIILKEVAVIERTALGKQRHFISMIRE